MKATHMTVTFRTHIAAAVTLLLSGVTLVHAQSLADAARKEEQRRQGVKASSKTLTNKDLPTVPPPAAVESSIPAQPDAASSTASNATPQADAKAEGQAEDATEEGKRDQKYWSGRRKALEEQVRRDRTFGEALQSRINALTTDFVNRDDPAQRAVIEKDRQAAVEELARLQKSVADGTKAIANLEEEARRAGVPAGWLR